MAITFLSPPSYPLAPCQNCNLTAVSTIWCDALHSRFSPSPLGTPRRSDLWHNSRMRKIHTENPRPKGKDVFRAIRGLVDDHRRLLVLPVMSAVFATLAIIIIALPVGAWGLVADSTNNQTVELVVYIVSLWVMLFVSTAIAVFFQVALVFGVIAIINGQTPTVGYCIGHAFSRLGKILGWAAISATVGVILRLLTDAATESNNGIVVVLGFLVRFVGQAAWAVASFFVIPMIVIDNAGPVTAMKNSVRVIKENFGTVVRSGARFGLYQSIPLLVGLFAFAIGIVILLNDDLVVPGVILIIIGIVILGITACIFSVYGAALKAVLYNYSQTGTLPQKPGSEVFDQYQKWMHEVGEKSGRRL